MPTTKQITDAIDARIDQLWPVAVEKQNEYAAARGGRYFQGLRTHSTLPADGAARDPDRLNARPVDHAETWNDVGFPVPSPRVAIELHAYTGGWVAVFRVSANGEIWQRSKVYGPETWREQAWTRVPPSEAT